MASYGPHMADEVTPHGEGWGARWRMMAMPSRPREEHKVAMGAMIVRQAREVDLPGTIVGDGEGERVDRAARLFRSPRKVSFFMGRRPLPCLARPCDPPGGTLRPAPGGPSVCPERRLDHPRETHGFGARRSEDDRIDRDDPVINATSNRIWKSVERRPDCLQCVGPKRAFSL